VSYQVLHEDGDLLAVAKPAGIPVIPARGEPPDDCLHARLEASRGERLWIVHRIDRDTSGVVVFARTAPAHRALSMAFEHRKVDKTYLAFAAGALDGVTRIDVPLHEARRGKARPAAPGEPGSKHAVTELAVERRWRRDDVRVCRVRCHPITGRHHQIRVHLRSVEAPIVHDEQYGKRTLRGPLAEAPCPRLALHAASLTVPSGDATLTFAAPVPADLAALEAWLDSGWEAA
jgi:tRNA pseudouridine32 synthase / 23S rRNA pseudouridine746 synthase